jgi:peptidoglycan biosynthesis protein MviN/MurJ (putative lipid II flippase)
VRYFEEARVGGEVGLGLANTMSATCNVLLLTYALRRKLKFLGLAPLRAALIALLAAGVLAGLMAAVLSWAWTRHLGHATLPAKLGGVFVPMAAGGLVYWLVALGLKVPAATEMLALVRQKLSRAKG